MFANGNSVIARGSIAIETKFGWDVDLDVFDICFGCGIPVFVLKQMTISKLLAIKQKLAYSIQ